MKDVHQNRWVICAFAVALGAGFSACTADTSNDSDSDAGGDDAADSGVKVIDNTKLGEDDECNGESTERCTDKYGLEVCPVDSGFPGDGLAPCTDIENTMVLHYGPKDYNDPDEVKKFILPAGGEDENCVFVESPNTEEVYLGTYHGRMRPNSHHLIVTLWDQLPDGVELGEVVSCDQTSGVGTRWLLGSQDPQIDLARGGAAIGAREAKPTEPDYKLGTRLPPKQIMRIDMHYLNPTQKELLREGWVFLELVPKEDVKTTVDMITFFQGSISVPPGATNVETAIGKCVAPSDRYVGLVTGHFHQNGTRFSVWHTNTAGDTNLVYETYDWENPGNAYYTDRMANPKVDAETSQWGATSGYLHVKKGESISFQCEYDNPTEKAITLGETGSDQMCNVFGMYFPSDGDNWNCFCLGGACFDSFGGR